MQYIQELHKFNKSIYGNYNYIYRVYDKPGTSEYIYVLPVAQIRDDLWEPHCWNKPTKFISDGKDIINCENEVMLFINNKLIELEESFKNLVGTFIKIKIDLYKRLFRKLFELEIFDEEEKFINGDYYEFYKVKFILKD